MGCTAIYMYNIQMQGVWPHWWVIWSLDQLSPPLTLAGAAARQYDKAGFNSDNCVDHHFQTWATSTLHMLMIIMHAKIVLLVLWQSIYSHRLFHSSTIWTDRMLISDNHLQWGHSRHYIYAACKLQCHHWSVINWWDYNTKPATVSAQKFTLVQCNWQYVLNLMGY